MIWRSPERGCRRGRARTSPSIPLFPEVPNRRWIQLAVAAAAAAYDAYKKKRSNDKNDNAIKKQAAAEKKAIADAARAQVPNVQGVGGLRANPRPNAFNSVSPGMAIGVAALGLVGFVLLRRR